MSKGGVCTKTYAEMGLSISKGLYISQVDTALFSHQMVDIFTICDDIFFVQEHSFLLDTEPLALIEINASQPGFPTSVPTSAVGQLGRPGHTHLVLQEQLVGHLHDVVHMDDAANAVHLRVRQQRQHHDGLHQQLPVLGLGHAVEHRLNVDSKLDLLWGHLPKGPAAGQE